MNKKLNVGILGFGRIGSSVVKIIDEGNEVQARSFDRVRACVRRDVLYQRLRRGHGRISLYALCARGVCGDPLRG